MHDRRPENWIAEARRRILTRRSKPCSRGAVQHVWLLSMQCPDVHFHYRISDRPSKTIPQIADYDWTGASKSQEDIRQRDLK